MLNAYLQKTDTHVFAINPLLSVDLEIPSKGSLEECLVLGVVLHIELLILIGLPIWGDFDDGFDILPASNKDTRNPRVTGGAKDSNRAEEILARSLESVEESTDLVGGHESLCQLFIVLEVDSPHGEAVVVEARLLSVTQRRKKKKAAHFS